MIIRQFYEKLGDFLYVFSKVDGIIHPKEEAALMAGILEILKEYPGFEKNAEVQDLLLTKLHFYQRGKEQDSVRNTTTDFLNFIDTNKNHISELSKSIALRLILKIAEARKGIDRSERKLIDLIAHKFGAVSHEK